MENNNFLSVLAGMGVYIADKTVSGFIGRNSASGIEQLTALATHGHSMEAMAITATLLSAGLGLNSIYQVISNSRKNDVIGISTANSFFKDILGQTVQICAECPNAEAAKAKLARLAREAATEGLGDQVIRACLFKHETQNKVLVPVGSDKIDNHELDKMRFTTHPIGSVASFAFVHNRAQIARALPKDPMRFDHPSYAMVDRRPLHRSVWCIPLESWGVISFYGRERSTFDAKYMEDLGSKFSRTMLDALCIIENYFSHTDKGK